MTAPGANLEFRDGPGFSRRAKAVLGLAEAVKAAIQVAPPVKGLQAWDCHFQKKTYGVILHRTAQRVSLLYIFDLPVEEKWFRAKLKELWDHYDA